jgi:hypothetical protein
LTQTDTRTLALTWIENNIPKTAKLGMDFPIYGPPLASQDHAVSGTKNLFVVRDFMGYGGLSYRSLDWYRSNGFNYLITSSFITRLRVPDADQLKKNDNFYEELKLNGNLVKEFRPYSDSQELPFIFDETFGPFLTVWDLERPGPTIRIYQVLE